MLIDHLIYRAPDLADAVADVEERFGVRAHAGGKHIGLGTHNALLALGPQTYLEIIAPDPGQSQPSVPRPFGLDGVNRGGLVGWAIACQDIDAAVADARRCGYDPGEVAEMQRAGPTGMVLRWRLTVNVVPGGLVPFLISWATPSTPPDQHRAGSPWSLSTSSTPIPRPSCRSLALLALTHRSGQRLLPRWLPTSAARMAAPCCSNPQQRIDATLPPGWVTETPA